jgi:hypothetical protein
LEKEKWWQKSIRGKKELSEIKRIIYDRYTVHLLRNFAALLRIWIRDPVSFWLLDPGSGMGKKSGSRSGIRTRDAQPGSYFWELRSNFLGKNT